MLGSSNSTRQRVRPSHGDPQTNPFFHGKYVIIEGGIGVGKTSLTRMLSRRWTADAFFEEFEENPFLTNGFYEDTEAKAFNTELYFLVSRYRQQRRLEASPGFVLSDYLFNKNWIFAQMNLSGEDLSTYQTVYDSLYPKVRRPDLVIFLKADLETLLRRIYVRDREFERSLSPKYLDRLIHEYHRFFANYSEAPVFTIDTSGLDFVNDSRDFDRTCNAIEERLAGQVQLSLRANNQEVKPRYV